MRTHVRLAIRCLVTALFVATAVTLGVSPATATALREWDIGQYDNCIDDWNNASLWNDAITPEDLQVAFAGCCTDSGGVVDPGAPGGCGAPPAVAASNTPIAPPVTSADPDVGTGPGAGPGPKPTKKPPQAPTAPAGDNDDGSGSGSGGNQNDSPVG